jgi:hypothetical protein
MLWIAKLYLIKSFAGSCQWNSSNCGLCYVNKKAHLLDKMHRGRVLLNHCFSAFSIIHSLSIVNEVIYKTGILDKWEVTY